MRRAMPCRNASRTAGISSSARRNASADSTTQVTVSTAVTVALRGAGSNSESSPK